MRIREEINNDVFGINGSEDILNMVDDRLRVDNRNALYKGISGRVFRYSDDSRSIDISMSSPSNFDDDMFIVKVYIEYLYCSGMQCTVLDTYLKYRAFPKTLEGVEDAVEYINRVIIDKWDK